MEAGRRRGNGPSLPEIRAHFHNNFGCLPARYKSIDRRLKYPIRISEGLRRLQ
jgi:hypothetical protein